MHKVLSVAVAAIVAGTLIAPPGVFAQTASGTSSLQAQLDQIKALIQQVQDLQNQINQLQIQKQQVASQVGTQISTLITTLKQGDSGENVKTLQALLAADPTIFPEQLITGFFGRLTSEAVKRFQRKNGIETLGFVGPRTLKKLNELFEEHPVAIQVATSTGERQICAVVPPGHLIAPGWLKTLDKHTEKALKKLDKRAEKELKKLEKQLKGKHEDEDNDEDENENEEEHEDRFILPICPPGIFPNPTSTIDTTAPVILSQSVVPATSSAVISWTTNEAADSQIFYGTTTSFGSSTTLEVTLVTAHAQTLTGLTPATTYFFQIRSKDAAGNLGISTGTFTTPALPDTTAPVISAVTATGVASTTATVNWTTDELSTSKVFYATSFPVNTGTASFVNLPALVTSHSVPLTGLTASSTYFYTVQSQDASANIATSAISSQQFMTTGL